MRLKPVDFRLADRPIRKADPYVSFEFPPPTPSVSFSQKGQDPNPGSDRNGLNVGNLPDNLKVHPHILCQTSVKKPSNCLTPRVRGAARRVLLNPMVNHFNRHRNSRRLLSVPGGLDSA